MKLFVLGIACGIGISLIVLLSAFAIESTKWRKSVDE